MDRLNVRDDSIQDIRFAIRQLRKSPAFAGAAIATLAAGIGASVAIFAFVYAALLKPLPYPSPARLVGVYETTRQFPQSNLSYLDYLDWKKLNTVFTSLSAYQAGRVTLSTTGGAVPVAGARVSDDFFRTLGVSPVLGRDFSTGEDLPAAARTVILSYTAWQSRYGGQADALGKAVTLNGAPNTIIGVLPPDFHFAPAGPAEFWTTLHGSSTCDARRSCHNMYGVARLKDGTSIQAASANVATIARQLEQQYPDSNRDQGSAVIPLADAIVGNVRPMLMVLLGGVGLLLLIATINVASLLLVRSESRKREIAVRFALGASRSRVMRQFLVEGLVLVTLGTAAGLVAAHWVIRLLVGLIPVNLLGNMPYLQGLGLNAGVLGFAGVVALLAAVLFAATPLLHLSLSNNRDGLTEGSRGSAGNTWRRVGSRLVALELATAVILLAGGGLLGRSLYRVLAVDVGLRADHVAVLGVAMPASTYKTDELQLALGRQILGRVSSLPGVVSVGMTSVVPMAGGNTVWIRVAGRPYNGEHNEVHYREVSAGYLTTLQARMLRGRHFTEDDDVSKPRVIIVNQSLVRQYFAGEDPIGRQLLYAPTTTQPPMEIVGVVDDVKENALDATTPPTMYVAFAQEPTTGFSLVVRTLQEEQTLLPTLSAAIHEIDPGISTFAGRTMEQIIHTSPAAYLRRSAAWLVGGFAGLAWLLSVVGLYGVVAYSVSQRTREIGVRMALGAERRSVCGLILGESARLTAIGVAVGLVCAVIAGTMMRGLLFGVRAWDVPTLAAAAIVLSASALLASYVPARRAASVSPVEALRSE